MIEDLVAKELAKHKIVSQGHILRKEDWSGDYVACKCSGSTEQSVWADSYIKMGEYHLHIAEALRDAGLLVSESMYVQSKGRLKRISPDDPPLIFHHTLPQEKPHD